jgi:hypothetical protein
MMRRIVLVVVLVPACEQVKKVDDEGGGACVPAEVQAAFDRSCSGSTCHVGASTPGEQLSLAAGDSAAAIGAKSQKSDLPLIELGNTSGSYLAQKMMLNPTAVISGDPMPSPFDPNNANQVADVNTILTWIGGGVFECESSDSTGTETMGTTGEPVLRACGLQDLAPGTESMIVAGTGAMQIPPDIATILEDNCGCHYNNTWPEPPPYIDYLEDMTAPFDMRTWAGFQEMAPAGMPFHALSLDRVNGGGAIAMPPPDPYCQAMPATESATLVEWLTAGAPDGATWMGTPTGTHVCGIEDLKAGAPNPIVSGTGAGQIPPDIGTILANNCGCHYADALDVAVPDYTGTADLATHAGFQAASNGGMLHETALTYVTTQFMPISDTCVQDDGNRLNEADYRTLTQWLGEGAPDGAEWMP